MNADRAAVALVLSLAILALSPCAYDWLVGGCAARGGTLTHRAGGSPACLKPAP